MVGIGPAEILTVTTSTRGLPIDRWSKPDHWFKSIHEMRYDGLNYEPCNGIEYLIVSTGETFVHTGGTAYWNEQEKEFRIGSMVNAGITHYRLLPWKI